MGRPASHSSSRAAATTSPSAQARSPQWLCCSSSISCCSRCGARPPSDDIDPGMKPYDLVLFGATGFTGRQAAHLLAEEAGDLKWAIAGRNADKLAALAAELPVEVDQIVADGRDAAAMSKLAASTRVVASTAGPFSLYSDALVAACVLHHTHYADITGETPWVRRLIDAHHAKAEADGTRIVPMCGFDSVPSDLGAWLVAKALADKGEQTREVRAAFKMKSGMVNGGTLASTLAIAEQEGSRAFTDPVFLHPAPLRTKAERLRHKDDMRIRHDERLGVVTAPFVMAPVNTRVVRRSAALLDASGHGYGPEFTYQEYLGLKTRRQAWAMALGLGGLGSLLMIGPGRALVRMLGPDPGQGPTQEDIDNGYSAATHVGEGSGGSLVTAKLRYAGDPANKATVRFLVSSALLLCGDTLDSQGGVITPAVAFGGQLVEHLRDHGVQWDVT
ncbi:MAG: saccharopine dehydrogenase [Deltaproteobacteria bacterium]|nr:MAG: saccharopine dehydrogenase [Deltaproteobacteria bacterium]